MQVWDISFIHFALNCYIRSSISGLFWPLKFSFLDSEVLKYAFAEMEESRGAIQVHYLLFTINKPQSLLG